MNQETKNTANTQAPETAAPVADIIRGRMPLPIVQCIKGEKSEVTDNTLAKKYRTTPGKVADIRQGRNFGYITLETKFTGDQLNDATMYAEQLAEADQAEVKKVLTKMKPGTAEDEAKLKDARAAARKSKEDAKPAVQGAGAAKEQPAKAKEKGTDADVKSLTN